jgi:hypothetical protein
VLSAVGAGVGTVVGVTTSFSGQALREAGASTTMGDLIGIPAAALRTDQSWVAEIVVGTTLDPAWCRRFGLPD